MELWTGVCSVRQQYSFEARSAFCNSHAPQSTERKVFSSPGLRQTANSLLLLFGDKLLLLQEAGSRIFPRPGLNQMTDKNALLWIRATPVSSMMGERDTLSRLQIRRIGNLDVIGINDKMLVPGRSLVGVVTLF